MDSASPSAPEIDSATVPPTSETQHDNDSSTEPTNGSEQSNKRAEIIVIPRNVDSEANEDPTTSASRPQTVPSNPETTIETGRGPIMPRTRLREKEILDSREVVDIHSVKEPTGTHESAERVRFSPFKLNEEEFSIFGDLIKHDLAINDSYLYIRDRILEQWLLNPQIILTREKAYHSLEDDQLSNTPSDLKDKLFEKTYNFLDRTGRINFGLLDNQDDDQLPEPSLCGREKRADTMDSHLYKPLMKSGPSRVGRVLIIGAGLSGLMAARQLRRFGMDVIVVEARNRLGGRIHTYRKGNFIADLGPSSINGVIGNPLVVLGRQLDICITKLKQKIPIFENKVDKNGVTYSCLVDRLLERALEREFNKIMEGTRVMKNYYNIERYKDQPFPVGVAVDWVMKLQEKNVKDELVKHYKAIDELYAQLLEVATKKLEKAQTIKKLHGELCSIKDSTDHHKDYGSINTFSRRFLTRDLELAFKEYELMNEREKEIRNKIDQINIAPPSDTYLSLSDRRLLDWHFAELEYALGCPINKLGIHHEDDERVFEGYHWMTVYGFNTIVEGIKRDINIELGTAVKKVQVHKGGCTVTTYQPDHAYSPYKEITADAVLCTIPLGVLQDSIVPSQQAAADPNKPESIKTTQKGYQPVIFSPPLPKWKTKTLNKIGCGNLNKIVLSFDKPFWDTSLHLFGVVDHKAVSRGEFFLFWHLGRTPTIAGLISGEAADYIENLPDVEVLDRCLNVLRSIYGVSNVPAPKDYVVTKWRKDPWAKGAWSYLTAGADGTDYDACAEPVILDEESEQPVFQETRMDSQSSGSTLSKENEDDLMRRLYPGAEPPRLFFAGEHTSRLYSASAHGALLTGLREASRIANIYLGCPYDEDKPGIVIS